MVYVCAVGDFLFKDKIIVKILNVSVGKKLRIFLLPLRLTCGWFGVLL